MKKILTHLLAFAGGVIFLPLVVFCIAVLFHKQILKELGRVNPGHVRYVADHGLRDLAKAKTLNERFYALGPAAKESFDRQDYKNAEAYATELAALVPKFQGDWNYGNAIQDSNVVLGRLALRNGDTATAVACLQNAGKSPGSPQMDSFGPNVSLARDLLVKGQSSQAVIEYLTACKSFWKMDYGKTDNWIAVIKQGDMPQFGANLDY